MKNLYIKFAFNYFIILACLGVLLRLSSVYYIPLNYKNILHTHSHIAFLGWVYSAIFALYIELFSSKIDSQLKSYRTQFILIQVVNLGMLISFPIQGYALFSIIFSTLHVIISYWFVYTILKDIKNNTTINMITKQFAKASLLFLILSSLGPFTLPIIIKIYGAGSDNYFNTIYYYLHFQYNGWFTFSILAISFRFLELKGVLFNSYKQKQAYSILFYSTFLTLFLSFLWTKPSIVFYILAGVGSVLQIIFTYFLYSVFSKMENANNYKIKTINKNILRIILLCFVLKMIFQLIGAFPYFADLSYEIRNFIIGYLHLFLIGVVSLSILFICIEKDYFCITSTFSVSIYLFIGGYVLSEIWIFLQGIFWLSGYNGIPYYTITLLVFSTFMMLATWIFRSKLK